MIPHELAGLKACCHSIYVGLNALRTTISEGHANLLILNGSSAASAISSGLIILSDGKDAFAVMSDSTYAGKMAVTPTFFSFKSCKFNV